MSVRALPIVIALGSIANLNVPGAISRESRKGFATARQSVPPSWRDGQEKTGGQYNAVAASYCSVDRRFASPARNIESLNIFYTLEKYIRVEQFSRGPFASTFSIPFYQEPRYKRELPLDLDPEDVVTLLLKWENERRNG